MSREERQVNLTVEALPKCWYNILPDLAEKGMPLPPPKDPEEGESRIAAMGEMMIGPCLEQEFSPERWIPIPEELRLDLYPQAGRPRPAFRAINLERRLGTKARLYYKAEFFSPTGSHKVNTALAQCYYARQQGFEGVVTETGAGQWGTALAYAAALTGLKCTVYWVRAVYNWKSDRMNLMKLLGAEVFASPSEQTEIGRKMLAENPQHPGSLGIAISEGLEHARRDPKAVYCLGSVLNHVLLHQTIIGLETQKQFEIFGDYPDIMISCLGGGSNFGGFVLPFVREVLRGKREIRFIASQSQVAPNLQGEYRYNFADYAGITPLLKMYTLGHHVEMEPIKADGLRYHGCSPIISLLRHHGYIDTVAYPADEKKVFELARLFIETEGWLPAPESAYSIACAIEEAEKPENAGKVIAFNVSGHGFMDMGGYQKVLGL